MFLVLVSVLAVTAVITVAILSRVDDWGRDFTTNVAVTRESSKLEPLQLSVSVEEATARLQRTVAKMSHWQWIDQSQSTAGVVTINLVRSTALFRFKDDVQVSISTATDGTGVVVNTTSRSRIGKGDLGQNPRNIKELFSRLSEGP